MKIINLRKISPLSFRCWSKFLGNRCSKKKKAVVSVDVIDCKPYNTRLSPVHMFPTRQPGHRPLYNTSSVLWDSLNTCHCTQVGLVLCLEIVRGDLYRCYLIKHSPISPIQSPTRDTKQWEDLQVWKDDGILLVTSTWVLLATLHTAPEE